MSTEAQVAELVAPFLERHPDFVRLKRVVLRVPFDHIKVGFNIGRTGHKGEIDPTWFAGPSFGPPPYFGGGPGQSLGRAIGHVHEPDIGQRLLAEMEGINSSFLEGARSLADLHDLQWVISSAGMRKCDQGLVLAALGRFEEAEEILRVDLHYRSLEPTVMLVGEGARKAAVKQRPGPADEKYQLWLGHLRRLYDLVAECDRAALGALLHEWEAQSASAKNIQHLWRPSPFPVELGAGD